MRNQMKKMTGKKSKIGRPLASPEVRDNTISIRLNSTELRALENWVWRYDTSISDTLRDVLMIMSIIPETP